MIIFTESNYKTITCGLFKFDIDSSWISGLEYNFKNEEHYRSYQKFNGKNVQIIPITQINHNVRAVGVPIFNDGKNNEGMMLTAKERVVNIFSGFENGEKMRPIVLYRQGAVDECVNLFECYDGCHRLHCSIVYGFKMIPTIIYKKQDLIA